MVDSLSFLSRHGGVAVTLDFPVFYCNNMLLLTQSINKG